MVGLNFNEVQSIILFLYDLRNIIDTLFRKKIFLCPMIMMISFRSFLVLPSLPGINTFKVLFNLTLIKIADLQKSCNNSEKTSSLSLPKFPRC